MGCVSVPRRSSASACVALLSRLRASKAACIHFCHESCRPRATIGSPEGGVLPIELVVAPGRPWLLRDGRNSWPYLPSETGMPDEAL